jgi:tripartite-type tricarboxylate transporter receptor subunit TctC
MTSMNTRLPALVAALAGVFALASISAQAQPAAGYPEKTVRIIVPFPAGGATDIIARIVGERLSTVWNRPVVVENISGAAGAAGTAQAAKAPPDGYSLLTATGTTTTLLHICAPTCPTVRCATSRRCRCYAASPISWWCARTFRRAA